MGGESLFILSLFTSEFLCRSLDYLQYFDSGIPRYSHGFISPHLADYLYTYYLFCTSSYSQTAPAIRG